LTRLERTVSYRTNNLGRFTKIEAERRKNKLRGGEQSFSGGEESSLGDQE
jgi:hypothetical protein